MLWLLFMRRVARCYPRHTRFLAHKSDKQKELSEERGNHLVKRGRDSVAFIFKLFKNLAFVSLVRLASTKLGTRGSLCFTFEIVIVKGRWARPPTGEKPPSEMIVLDCIYLLVLLRDEVREERSEGRMLWS